MDECRKCGYSKAEQARGSFLVCADCGEPWPTEQMPEHQRAITAHEGQLIAEFLGAHWGMDSKEEIDDIRESMRGAAVRKYMSDGPGYFGDIYFVVFGGGPEFHFVLTNYKDEGFRIVEREFPNVRHDPSCAGDPARCDCL